MRQPMGRPIAYDPASGRDYATNVTFTPESAAKLIGMARASRVSVRDVVRYLVDAAETDGAGRAVAIERMIAAEEAAAEEERKRREEESLF